MAGIALKGQCDFVSIIVPPEVSLKEKCLAYEKKNISEIERNATSSRSLMESSVATFSILIEDIKIQLRFKACCETTG